MRMRIASSAVLLAACSNRPAEVADGAIDAAPDAGCVSAVAITPITVTGSSPAGSLDVFRFAYAAYTGGACADNYVVHLLPTADDPVCVSAPTTLDLMIFAPFSTTGTHRAQAYLIATPKNVMTDEVTFEATQLEPPDAAVPRISGRFVSQDPAWSFDIPVDLTSQGSSYCI